MKKCVLAGDDPLTARTSPEIMEPMLAVRRAKNRPGGYWLLADEPAAANHLLELNVALSSVEAMILGSDGFFRLLDLFSFGRKQIFSIAESGHLEALGLILRDLEKNAPFVDFPRVSVYDDATAVLLTRLRD